MIEEYVPSDTNCDFHESFMERRLQKLNDPKKIATDISIRFHVVPLSSAPTALPTKRISNTGDDSGVNLSPTFRLPYLHSQ